MLATLPTELATANKTLLSFLIKAATRHDSNRIPDQHAQRIVVASMTTLMNVGQKTYFHAIAIITIPIDAISAIWFTVLWIIVGLLHGDTIGLLPLASAHPLRLCRIARSGE